MDAPFLSTLSKLFRDTEQVFGSRDFCFLSMESFKKAIFDFKGDSILLREEVEKMVDIVKNTSPRIALLMFMVFKVVEDWQEFQQQNPDASVDEDKKFLCHSIDEVQKKRKRSVQKLLHHSDEVISDDDVVLLHDTSHTIFDILLHAKEDGKKFQIVLAEQEAEKTAIIIRFLSQNNFEFQVIPEYLLSYMREKITKAMVGAVTINSLHEVVADAGSGSLVSQMQAWNIPVMVPITTDKFSLWEAEAHHTFKSVKRKMTGGVEYEKLIFSHDRYPIAWVSTFITNKGLLNAAEMENMYSTYYSDCNFWREKNQIV